MNKKRAEDFSSALFLFFMNFLRILLVYRFNTFRLLVAFLHLVALLAYLASLQGYQ